MRRSGLASFPVSTPSLHSPVETGNEARCGFYSGTFLKLFYYMYRYDNAKETRLVCTYICMVQGILYRIDLVQACCIYLICMATLLHCGFL